MKRTGVLLGLLFCLGVLADRLVTHLLSGNRPSPVSSVPASVVAGVPENGASSAPTNVSGDSSQPVLYTYSAQHGPGKDSKENQVTLAAHNEAAPINPVGAGPAVTNPAPTQPNAAPATPNAAPAQPGPAQPAPEPAPQGNGRLEMSRVSLTAKADLSHVTFTYHITPTSGNADVGMQIFAHRDDIKTEQKWDAIYPVDSAGKALIFSLYQGIDNTGTFDVLLPKGVYGATRVILFAAPDGKNMDTSKLVYDTNSDPKAHLNLNLNVVSSDKRVTIPVMAMVPKAEVTEGAGGTYNATFMGIVKVPQDYHPQDAGFWVMAKGSGGFVQGWAAMKDARPAGDATDNYLKIPIRLTIKNVKTGVWNVQFGLFKASWGDPLEWVYPGVDFAVGDWVQKAPADRMPPRLRVQNNRFETLDGKPYDFYADKPTGKQAVSFVRGGNYGNAIGWTIMPEYNRPGYFVLLRQLGCHFMRIAYNPDRYLGEQVYRDAVDQIVQNMWTGGLYPVIGPQGLLKASTLQEQIDKTVKLVELMTTRYKGKPVWMEVCNEPFQIPDWSKWKPVAIRMVRAARAIDPDAFLIVPFEGWSKDARAAAKDPIKEVHVDLYDAHAYVQPEDMPRLYTDALKAGLPLYIGEYGGNDATYLSRMDAQLQSLHGVIAAGPWAFTKIGQDGLPLIADGSTAVLKFTPAGKQIASDYSLWDLGKRKTQ